VRALVTGIAGFIGSTLGEELLRGRHEVVGVDSFTNSYDVHSKRRNVEPMLGQLGFHLVEGDLTSVDLAGLLERIDVVFHLAGLAGTRDSWGTRFTDYEHANVSATQRLLEACRATPIRRFIYSSSSSVYGLASRFPARETDLPRPLTPYAVDEVDR
jgi:UDP-glucuronate 4-epimerase